jgi:predicted RNA-binding Zn-ribbon protein involved in translation (DUF1610 family)
MMSEGAGKYVCSNCGEKEMFFTMDDVTFCGSCAKKIEVPFAYLHARGADSLV